MNKEKQQSIAASEFAKRWMGRGYEKGDSQIFWADLLTNVYGVKNIAEFIFYEEQGVSGFSRLVCACKSRIKCCKSVHEEPDVSHSPKLGPESFYLGIE